MEDPALYHARRLHADHTLSCPATTAELRVICEWEGVSIRTSDRLSVLGLYVPHPEPLILLQRGVGRWVLAHELYHHLDASSGASPVISLHSARGGRRRRLLAEERAAQRFSRLLCHPDSRTEMGLPERLPGVAIYAWSPRAERLGGTHSTERQARLCARWAAEKSLRVLETSTDCGDPWARPGAQALAARAEVLGRQGVGLLVLAHWSRLGATPGARAPLLQRLGAAGIDVHSLEEPQWSTAWKP